MNSQFLFFMLGICTSIVGASVLLAGRAWRSSKAKQLPPLTSTDEHSELWELTQQHLVGPHASLAYRVPADRPSSQRAWTSETPGGMTLFHNNPPVKVVDPFADMFPPIDYEPLSATQQQLLRTEKRLLALEEQVRYLSQTGKTAEHRHIATTVASNLKQLREHLQPPTVGALYEDRSFASDHVFTDEEMNLPTVNGRIASENERRKILVRQVRGDAVLYCLVYAEDAFLPRATTKNISSIVSVFNHMYVRSRTEK